MASISSSGASLASLGRELFFLGDILEVEDKVVGSE
jgi:hypothetical protein